MFRRKEEGSNDSVSEVMAATLNLANENTHTTATENTGNRMNTNTTNEAVSQPPSQPVTASAPMAANAPQSLTRPAAPVSPAAGGYRPTPVQDFNRTPAARPAGEPVRPASAHTQPATAYPATATEKPAEAKRAPRILTVGNDILLKGEIETCDRVIIEGRVEAKLSDVHTLAIAASGTFKGTAEVEQAEITGLFEGDLIVKGRLVIYTTGEVRGNITYGEIEIERGGRLTGQIKTVAESMNQKMVKPTLLDALDKPVLRQKEAMQA